MSISKILSLGPVMPVIVIEQANHAIPLGEALLTGGIKTIEQAKKVFDLGYEKIILNSSIFQNPNILIECADTYGSQAVVCSIDVKKNFLAKNLFFPFWND